MIRVFVVILMRYRCLISNDTQLWTTRSRHKVTFLPLHGELIFFGVQLFGQETMLHLIQRVLTPLIRSMCRLVSSLLHWLLWWWRQLMHQSLSFSRLLRCWPRLILIHHRRSCMRYRRVMHLRLLMLRRVSMRERRLVVVLRMYLRNGCHLSCRRGRQRATPRRFMSTVASAGHICMNSLLYGCTTTTNISTMIAVHMIRILCARSVTIRPFMLLHWHDIIWLLQLVWLRLWLLRRHAGMIRRILIAHVGSTIRHTLGHSHLLFLMIGVMRTILMRHMRRHLTRHGYTLPHAICMTVLCTMMITVVWAMCLLPTDSTRTGLCSMTLTHLIAIVLLICNGSVIGEIVRH
mmetsp:Transcript_31420/g.50893  ORF Transcript_31420/g.50893 Transcript_31420/m.50893 type:complete len:348 (+) Transcript_31420:247-1290(+)